MAGGKRRVRDGRGLAAGKSTEIPSEIRGLPRVTSYHTHLQALQDLEKAMSNKWYYIAWTFFFVGILALVGVAEWAEPETKAAVFEEMGLVENMSAAGYFIGFVLLLVFMILKKNPTAWSLAVAMLCLCFRELDFHKHFTTMSILKSRFLTSPEVPADERFVGILVIIMLLVCVFFVLKNYLKPFLLGLRKRTPVAFSVFFAGGCLVVSKSLDGIARKLEPLGIMTTEGVKDFCSVLEESLETAAPYLLVLAIAGSFRRPEARLTKETE